MMLSAAGWMLSMPRCGATWASRCQTSSVKNGIIGCSSLSSVSSVWAKHPLGDRPVATRLAAGL